MDACPQYEAELCAGRPVIGVDEVGRGPLAGPVVAAAAYLPVPIEGLRDSKRLTEKRRDVLAATIRREARFALGAVSAPMIDRIGIGKATKLAMARAVAALGTVPVPGALVLIDGNQPAQIAGYEVRTEVKADGSCPSVAAAAIVAKVARDRAMALLSERYAPYGWHTNKGYGSASHRAAIEEHGASPHHRRSFLGKILA